MCSVVASGIANQKAYDISLDSLVDSGLSFFGFFFVVVDESLSLDI